MNGKTDTVQLIIALRNFANPPNNFINKEFLFLKVCIDKDTAELKFSHLASCAYAFVFNCSSSCLGRYELHYVVGMGFGNNLCKYKDFVWDSVFA
jgi:hypothetical protein